MFINFLGKLALGDMRQVVHINGQFADTIPLIYNNFGNGQGGIFAQPSNIGEHKKNRFAIVPEVLVRFGVNIIKNLRISIGYDFLYLSSVVRPGDQIDSTINESQAGPNSNAQEPVLTGPNRPKVRHHNTDYWAQGINAGIEFRF